MYKSPINMMESELQMQLEGEVMKAVKNVGVNVDKEELLRALKYDREQYYRGYNDAVDEFVERIKEYVGELDCEEFLSDIRHIADIMKV